MEQRSELIVRQAKPMALKKEEQKKSIVDILTRTGTEIVHGQKQYLYKPYFPMKKYCIITADPGTGKTKFICGIAAKVSTGADLCGIPCQNKGNVVIFSREDDADDIVTTFKACGGDESKLTVLADDDDDALDYMAKHPLYFSSPEVEAIIKAKQPSFVVFDPMQKYIPPNVDTFRNNQTSAALSFVIKLASKYDCVIAIITHNVKMKVGLSLQAQVNGSSDIIGGSRSALAIVPYPESNEKGNNLAIHVKSNNKIGKAIHYQIKSIEGDEDFATVDFMELIDYYESDYVRELRKGKACSDYELNDENYIIQTLLQLMEENPRGYKIDKDTLQESVYEYTDQTINIKIADIINKYAGYMSEKHGIGLQKIESTTVSEIVRNKRIIKPPDKNKSVIAVRRNVIPKKSKKYKYP